VLRKFTCAAVYVHLALYVQTPDGVVCIYIISHVARAWEGEREIYYWLRTSTENWDLFRQRKRRSEKKLMCKGAKNLKGLWAAVLRASVGRCASTRPRVHTRNVYLDGQMEYYSGVRVIGEGPEAEWK
jgi:hypothetical protein